MDYYRSLEKESCCDGEERERRGEAKHLYQLYLSNCIVVSNKNGHLICSKCETQSVVKHPMSD